MKQEQASVSEQKELVQDRYHRSLTFKLSSDIGAPGQEDQVDLDQPGFFIHGMKKRLCIALDAFFPRSTPFSILLLHIVQFKQGVDGQSKISVHRRYQQHIAPGLLEQVLANARRAIRRFDPILVHSDASAALLFPDTDQWGASSILERVYNSISLLQSETITPPLMHKTIISLAVSTYPDPCSSLESLLDQLGSNVRSLMLRPVVAAQLQVVRTQRSVDIADPQTAHISLPLKHSPPAVPFMQLPKALPQDVRRLLPYQIALQFRCVPVGYEQRYLTIAAARPLDRENLRDLQNVTGMSIFPVFCREDELTTLLANSW